MQTLIELLAAGWDWTIRAFRFTLLWTITTSALIGLYAGYVFVHINYYGEDWQMITPSYPAPPQRIDWGLHEDVRPGDLESGNKKRK